MPALDYVHKRGETGRNRVTQDRPFKPIKTYSCLSKSCPCELLIVHFPPFGLVLFEKQKIENGVPVPVAHDKGAHDYVPTLSKRGSQSSLSHTQKEFIVKNARLNGN